MSIEQRLHQYMAAQDPGPVFTSAVMARVRARPRLRPWLIMTGAALFATAAAAMLALQWAGHGESPPPAATAAEPAAIATPVAPDPEATRIDPAPDTSSIVGQEPVSRDAAAQSAERRRHGQLQEEDDPAFEVNMARMVGLGRYPDAQQELGLSPAQTDSLFLLLLKNAKEHEIEAQLGPTRYQQWKDYQTRMDSNRRVETLRTNLAVSGDPLRDDQARALTATILAEQRRRNSEMRLHNLPTTDPRAQVEIDELNVNITEASYRRIADAAKSYLSAQQLFLMQNSMNQQIASQRKELQERRAMIEGRVPAAD